MYEKEMLDMTKCETKNETMFNFAELQAKKRALAEENLIMSEKILSFLIGTTRAENEETQHIGCFMGDLSSEKETLEKLHDNLYNILSYLGA